MAAKGERAVVLEKLTFASFGLLIAPSTVYN